MFFYKEFQIKSFFLHFFLPLPLENQVNWKNLKILENV